MYRKATHTDCYLHFQSNHLIHMKRGLVKCLYDRAKNVALAQTESFIKQELEESYLNRLLQDNGYPIGFICNASGPSRWITSLTEEEAGPDEEEHILNHHSSPF